MRMWSRRSRMTAAALAATVSAGLLGGCASSTGPGKPDKKITVWTLESLPPRIAATEKVIDRFEKQSGVEVELVGVEENQVPQLIMSAAAAGDLPDVIGALTLSQTWQMYSNGLLNTQLPGDIVDSLGRDTFSENALDLSSDGGTRLAVPSDAWLQLLVYRQDRFDDAGLAAPDTYEKVLDAADTLDTRGRVGVSAATDPGDVFTQQSFESLALANGCELVNDRGDLTLDSPRCVSAFETYNELAGEHGAPGIQTVDSTRATYFAGQSSMVIWSSFILDELAGLRSDALPSCPECKDDPEFLSSNSGVTTAVQGPDGAEPAQYGEVTSWVSTRTAETAASRDFIEYMMSAGYEDWFGMAPEGKIPVRQGTAEEPERYADAWRSSRMGTDSFKRMDKVLAPELLDELVDGVDNMKRWGLAQGEGALVGAFNGELPVPKAIGSMTSGQIAPPEAARESQEEAEALQTSLQ